MRYCYLRVSPARASGSPLVDMWCARMTDRLWARAMYLSCRLMYEWDYLLCKKIIKCPITENKFSNQNCFLIYFTYCSFKQIKSRNTQKSIVPIIMVFKHRRRIRTEEKAKVVTSFWGAEFIQFLVALAVLYWTDWRIGIIAPGWFEEKDVSSYSSKSC